MRNSRLCFNLIVTLVLLMAALGRPSMTVRAGNGELKADPRLLAMAAENPDAIFMVIVQKEAGKKDLKALEPEVAVTKGGGKVKEKFGMILSFSAEMTGREITRLARSPKVRWISVDAPMVSTARPGMESARDEFTSLSYGGNNGDINWTTGWVEVGEKTDHNNGSIVVENHSSCKQGSCMRFKPSRVGVYVYRQVDLSGYVSVWLSFDRNNGFGSNATKTDEVRLEISPNGGASWTTLRTYASDVYPGAATDSFDISAYASSNTQIRFIITGAKTGAGSAFFDNIEIAFARPSAYLSTVRADQVALDGRGVTVAVVDSGLTTKNNDFMGGLTSRITANVSFGNQAGPKDEYGHGTHVAGIVAGNGAASGGKYRGMATGVSLINLRVSDKDGLAHESNLVKSLEWIYNNRQLYNIRVVNISMNSTVAQSYHTSPLSAAVEILWFNGIVVIVSAGNNGSADGPSMLYPPANDPFVITVGATEDRGTPDLGDDRMAVFSAYGLTGDNHLKPDLVAPGRNLIAPLSEKASTVFNAHPMHRVGESYFRMSGTSMSAPVVSGAVALLLQDEPKLSPDQVKFRLMATANTGWNGFSAEQSGAGYLDVYAAVTGTTVASANQGILPSQMLGTGSTPIAFGSVGWNSVGWNSVGWNSVGWNSVGWNSVGWNSVGWNASTWDD